MPTPAVCIVWLFPSAGFITLDLFHLNYKSQLKLNSSCHCPDMWLVGVIVFFIFPISNLPFPCYLKLVYLKIPFFPILTTPPPTLNLWSCSSRSAQSATTLLYVFPVAEAERCQNRLHLLQTRSPDCQQGNNFSLSSQSTTSNDKVIVITIRNPSHAQS